MNLVTADSGVTACRILLPPVTCCELSCKHPFLHLFFLLCRLDWMVIVGLGSHAPGLGSGRAECSVVPSSDGWHPASVHLPGAF